MSVREGASYITARTNDPWDAAYSAGAASKLAQTAAQNSKLEGLVYFITHWPLRCDDIVADQVFTAGAHHTGVCGFVRLLEESQRTGEVASWMQPNSLQGAGFHFGVYTLKRTPYVLKSIELFHPALFPHLPSVQGHAIGPLTQEDEERYAPYGFSMTCGTDGGIFTFHRVYYTHEEINEVWSWVRHEEHKMLLGEPFIAHTSSLAGQKAPPFPLWGPYNYHVNVYVAKRYGDDKTEEELRGVRWTLYHTKKVNVEITPAHLTKYDDGVYVNIVVTPIGNRVITEFTVQGVDHLVDGTEINEATQIFYPDPENRPDGYKPGQARYLYGPIHSDIYVTAVAEGVEVEEPVKAGIPYTIQLTTDDCLVEAGSWELGDTNLPSSVTYSISELGLVDIYIPQDVYDGNPGGVYYLNVTFNGYSQTKGLTLLITVEDSPAYGTVWTAQDLLDGGAVNDIFVDSNDDIYITTEAKVFKTTSDLATFTELTLTGTIVSYLGNIQEVADGRLILSDRTGIWIKEVGSDEFVRQSLALTNWSQAPAVRLAAGPDDNFFFVTHSSNTGLVTFIDRYSLDALGAYESRYVNNETLLPFYPAPIRAAENVWCFMVGGTPTAGCALIRYADGVFTRLIQDILVDTSGAGAGSFTMEDSGRIWLAVGDYVPLEYKCQTRYSDDAGETWSEPQLATILADPETVSLTTLKENYGVFGLGRAIYRSSDGYATTESVQALDGNVNVIKMIKYRKLLAGTAGTTSNLYLSEA